MKIIGKIFVIASTAYLFGCNNAEIKPELPKVANPVKGIVIENSNVTLDYPPSRPNVLSERYWFGYFWSRHDFNGDGILDYLYTGTMHPNNINDIGTTTGGICGGDYCKGQMPSPSLFIGESNNKYVLKDELFIDNRKTPGFSLARQNLVADFNADGVLDLFVADHGIGTHKGIRDSYYLSQPNGTWIESSDTHLSHSNYRIFDHGGAVGDIDQDGDIDIVLTELKNQLTCWMNDGTGHMKKKTCGNVNAFAIELGDMDGDGDLDLVHAGHENEGSTPTGIAYNNGNGGFYKKKRLPQIKKWSTVPELSLWDLDKDGDLDIVLSRAGHLYVGTGAQIIENKSDGFASQFFPFVEAPESYKPRNEGNSWNNFIENFLFKDIDQDGDDDIIIVGGGNSKHSTKVRASILRNEGDMKFKHIYYNENGNTLKKLNNNQFKK